MSGDLISRKELMDQLSRSNVYRHITNAEGKNTMEIVEEMPTAYDVDKVVGRIEEIRETEYASYKEARDYVEDEKHRYAYRLVGDIEEIVKRGGVNE